MVSFVVLTTATQQSYQQLVIIRDSHGYTQTVLLLLETFRCCALFPTPAESQPHTRDGTRSHCSLSIWVSLCGYCICTVLLILFAVCVVFCVSNNSSKLIDL